MPNYKGHLIGGFLTAFLLSLALSTMRAQIHLSLVIECMFYSLFTLVGSLFPDIDTKSKGQRLCALLLIPMISIIIYYQQWIILSCVCYASMMLLLSRHRGITHQVWFNIATPSIMLFSVMHLTPYYTSHATIAYLFFVAGAISHLFLDFGPTRFWQRGLFAKTKRRRKR